MNAAMTIQESPVRSVSSRNKAGRHWIYGTIYVRMEKMKVGQFFQVKMNSVRAAELAQRPVRDWGRARWGKRSVYVGQFQNTLEIERLK